MVPETNGGLVKLFTSKIEIRFFVESMHDYDTQRQQTSDCPSKIPPRTNPKSRLNNGNQDFYYSLTINQLYNVRLSFIRLIRDN